MSGSPSDELIKGFIEEVKSYVPSLIQGIESLKENPDQSQILEETHRLAHTIKGASSLVGINGLSHIAYQMEEALEDAISGKLVLSGNVLRIMSRTIEQFQEYCRGYLDREIDEHTMLKETVLAFRRIRGLPADGDEEALKPLLESIPEPEETAVETKAEAEFEKEIKAPPTHQVKPSLPPVEMMEGFYEEAEGYLEDMSHSLNILESKIKEPTAISQSLRDVLGRIRRSVHTLKGAAGMVGRKEISKWAHSMEDLLDWLFEEAQDITPEIVIALIDSGDLLERFVTRPQDVSLSVVHSLKEKFAEIIPQSFTPEETDSLLDEPEPMIDMKEILARPSVSPIGEEEWGELDEVPAADFFLEQREIPTEAAFRYSRTLRVGPEKINELVNLAGELSISLSTFDQKMDIFAEAVNELEMSRDRLRDIARDLEVGYEVKALERLGPMTPLAPTPEGIPHPAPFPAMERFDEFDPLELDRYSELNLIIRTLNEATIDAGAISTQLANLHSDFDGYVTRQGVLLSEFQDKMMRLQMTPMAVITNRMQRTMREVAANLGKQVSLVVEGEDIELDRLIWEKITDPLMHLLRNAIDHGIEPPALRQALEKPPIGAVKLAASREGNQVVIRIADDGAGLNYQAIRAMALKAGLSNRADEMSEDELTSLIFHPGFSTRGEITEVSGRGVGLDVVKENIQELKGAIRVSSQTGKGTRFTVRIPLTLAVVHGLLFTVAGRVFAVALNEISEIVRINPANVKSKPEDTVRIGDEILLLYYLERLLSAGKKDEKSVSAPVHPLILVAESEGRRVALAVDTLIGQKEIVIKNLGSHLRYVKGISGATVMGDGSAVPIINIEELLGGDTVTAEVFTPEREFVLAKPLKILIVDDSISVRQVVSMLMEAQGWNIQTARDGIEALDRVRESRPDLIVLDIEMPRMNGYEFMGALKAQPGYEDIPIVILTSRTAPKHREKAMALGAEGFIIKPYKDDEFINLVLNLTGGGRNV